MPEDDPEIIIEYVDESNEQLSQMSMVLEQLQSNLSDESKWTEVFRLLHAIEGASGMLGLATVGGLIGQLDRTLKRYRDRSQRDDEDIHADCLLNIDLIRECHQLLRAGQPIPAQEELFSRLKQ